MKRSYSGTKVLGWLALTSIAAAIALSFLWKPPPWSLEDASRALPGVPPSVITAYHDCHQWPPYKEPRGESSSKGRPADSKCIPYVATEEQTLNIPFEPLESLQGLWATTASRASWKEGRLRVDPHVDNWGKKLFSTGGDLKLESVQPYLPVILPKLRASQLDRGAQGFAKVTVSYPVPAAESGYFDVSKQTRSRQFRVYLVSAREMKVLKQNVQVPVGIRDRVIAVLWLWPIIAGLAWLAAHWIRRKRARP